ncbi:AAA family ATPase, partial [Aquiluna sp.]|nr:AAA family ATPase [Aquiluna sp.]
MGYSDQAKTSEAILEADNLLILGAPGSGKTTMLSFVTKRLEDQGFKPEDILTVVPTRAAATSLRDQLAIDS